VVKLSRRQRLATLGVVALAGLGGAVAVTRSSGSGKSSLTVQAAGRSEPRAIDDPLPAPAPSSSSSSSTTAAKPATTTTKAPRPTTTSAPSTSTTVAPPCAPAAPIYSLALLRRPDGNGWSGGANPALERSGDGGQTWTAACLQADAVTGPGGIYGIAFTSDGTRGWATGGSGQHPIAFRTSDGGDHWLASTLPADLTGSLGTVAFVDDRRGWTVGSMAGQGPANAVGGYVLTTSDGGVTWATRPVPSTVARLNRVVFADTAHGWAVGVAADGKPALVATDDGGVTWSLQTIPDDVRNLRDVGFLDARRGWAVGDLPPEPGTDPLGVVLTTADGGATWAQQATTSNSLWTVAVIDDQTLYAGGVRGLWATHDGGITWDRQPFALPALDAISFTDADHGWVTHSMFSTVCRTDDGGRTWVGSDVRGGSKAMACIP
jgi:photosystem II stability/assembly factor-like uncharacterized protein